MVDGDPLLTALKARAADELPPLFLWDLTQDGSCQFSALAHQRYGDDWLDHLVEVRKQICDYLETNAALIGTDGPVDWISHLEEADQHPRGPVHMTGSPAEQRRQFVEHLRKRTSWGGHLTLEVAATVMTAHIRVLSAQGSSFDGSIGSLDAPHQFVLGHISERHYVSLSANRPSEPLASPAATQAGLDKVAIRSAIESFFAKIEAEPSLAPKADESLLMSSGLDPAKTRAFLTGMECDLISCVPDRIRNALADLRWLRANGLPDDETFCGSEQETLVRVALGEASSVSTG